MTIPEGSLTRLLREALAPNDARGSSWDAALFPGAIVGRFEMVREIGRGGFGTVWEARDTALKRRVAFKAIGGAGRSTADDRALAEAEAAAHLLHPNVVTLFDLGRCEHGAFLVMELLEGRSLREALEAGPLPPAEAARIGAAVAAGLAHAHGKGVLHRDLTPSNVFLCANGDVKLLDLGLSRVLGRDGGDVGPHDGTPGHAPPERLRGEPEDARSDLHALGLLLLLMLGGRLPDGGAPQRGPGLRLPGPPVLTALVTRLLDPEPSRRPATAGEVQDALERIAAARGPGTKSGTTAPATGAGPARRWRPGPGGIAVVGLVLLTVAATLGALGGRGAGGNLDVQVADPVLAPGRSTQATVARPGGSVKGPVVWSVSDPAVAIVNGSGTVRARGVGTTTLTATARNGQGSASVVVAGPEWRLLARPSLTPPPPDAKLLPPDRKDDQHVARVQGRSAWVQSGEDGDLLLPVELPGPGDLYALQAEVFRGKGRVSEAELALGLVPLTDVGTHLRAKLPAADRWRTLRLEGSRTRCMARLFLDGVQVAEGKTSCSLTGMVRVTLGAVPGGAPVAWSNLLVFEGVPASAVAVVVQVLPAGGPAFAKAIATVTDASGHPLPGRTIEWMSSEPSIASVDDDGRILAHARGRVTITARCEGKSASAVVDVPGPGGPGTASPVPPPEAR